MTIPDALGRLASTGGGTALALASRAAAGLRPSAKPLHPTGRVVKARLRRHGLAAATGVAFLDGSGDEDVLVRVSRSVGLPERLPDIHGLALRVTNADGSPGDVLLASTGWGRWTRFLLTPSRATFGRPMTTLFPYRTPGGPLLLGARSDQPRVVVLGCAGRSGPWRVFADLTLSTEDAGDPTISFDPVLHTIPGLEQYPAVARLRAPAYHVARVSRAN